MYLVDGCCIRSDYGIVGKERTLRTLAEVLDNLSHVKSNLCPSIHKINRMKYQTSKISNTGPDICVMHSFIIAQHSSSQRIFLTKPKA